jgi:hypothetical protein
LSSGRLAARRRHRVEAYASHPAGGHGAATRRLGQVRELRFVGHAARVRRAPSEAAGPANMLSGMLLEAI